MLKITHCLAGFYSNCSVRLDKIIKYFNDNQKIPETIDDIEMYHIYKPNNYDKNKSIVYQYFINRDDTILYTNKINYYEDLQFSNYNVLDISNINPFIKKYFTPTDEIYDILRALEIKYDLNDYTNICCLFYRGNDKIFETQLPSYDDYLIRARRILEKNPNVRFLIQSDETEFVNYIQSNFPNNSFHFKDETRNISKQLTTVDQIAYYSNNNDQNYHYSKYFLAITLIMGKCNDVICISGNCSIWIAFFRGNNTNFQQFFEGQWLENSNNQIIPKKYRYS